MNHIMNQPIIDESSIKQDFYFQSIFQEACNTNLISEQEAKRIQMELVTLMTKQVERYTNDESSSVPVEKAQEILQSICYGIGIQLKKSIDTNDSINQLKKSNLSELYIKGLLDMNSIYGKGKELLENLQHNRIKTENIAYHDTLFVGIPKFFHDYNMEFGAHDNPGFVDYPLCNPVEHRLGIEFIYEYLIRLTEENIFCKRFPAVEMEQLLYCYDKESIHLLVNLYELVITNALGCELTGQIQPTLQMRPEDLIWMMHAFEGATMEQLYQKLFEAYEAVAKKLFIKEETPSWYTMQALKMIAARFAHNLNTGTLEQLFIISKAKVETRKSSYVQGKELSDDELRDIMEELRECYHLSDKLALIKRSVRNLDDLIELLKECFFGEELTAVYDLLNKEELAILHQRAEEEAGYELEAGITEKKEWHLQIVQYLETHPGLA
ncbi:MAG: hypothetical protein K0S47_1201 [Herbinix sp.]|jgi:hypothetical protein|nr:hypothetical protein [Herbinix sp.]